MHTRPSACEGCPACPGSSAYDPVRTGAFVPPMGPYGSILDPTDLSWRAFYEVDLVIIGMNPSFREVDEGEPLVGPTYVEMRRGLGPALETSVLLKLNYVNCRTWKKGKTVDFINRDPVAAEAKACALRWLVPILRTLAEAEREGATIHLWVLGQKAFDVVFQGKYGTFGGSKGSRGQRVNRRKETYDILADRIERWATKATKAKTRHCTSCGDALTEPRVRLCQTCRAVPLAERKAAVLARGKPSSEAATDPPSPSSPSAPAGQPDEPVSPRPPEQRELPSHPPPESSES